MVIKSVNLETVCGITSKLPENTLPEVAFAGKSNVGKSSLINAIMNRKSYAKTSSQPGKTQTINFYNINNVFYCVDLPGYGYAKTTLETRAKWGKMIERYLSTSKQLQRVFLLIDIRHAPSENDRLMYEWIVSEGYEPVIIATKLDKIKRSVPGRITDSGSRGCNGLIRMGAVCVTQVEDILDEMGINRAESKAFNKNLLAPAEKKVYSCVRLESRHIDDICFETGISVSEVTQILYELEQKRLIKQLVRNYYVRA